MAVITKIEAQKRKEDRVNIYVDEKFFMAIYKELVFTFNLKKGDNIDEEYLKKILKDEMFLKCKNKALNILSKASQSEKKIREKLNEDFEEGVELFSDIILNPIFPTEGFEEEMNVIKEELRDWDEELEQYCEDKLFLNSFRERRIKYPIIGTNKDLQKIKLEDIKQFYKDNYLPDKTSIAVVSSLEFEEVKNIVESYFENWSTEYNGNNKEKIIYDKTNFGVYKEITEGINTCKVQVIFPIDDLSYNEIKALRIFNEYFGEGVNSLVFDTLRTKNGLVYDILTKISYEKYIKLYKITYSTSKENLDKSLELINECIDKIDRFEVNISKDDIFDFKKSMKLKRWFREEQNIILAKELSTYSTMFGDYKIYSEEFNNLDAIDKNYILDVAKKVLENKSIQVISN